MMNINLVLTYVSVVATVLAAVLSLRAATVEVRDNMDAFIGDLKRQSRWNAWAAFANSVAAAVLIFQALR